jgi:GTP:adenosylcobinamide-phosphate guanylyltransferase
VDKFQDLVKENIDLVKKANNLVTLGVDLVIDTNNLVKETSDLVTLDADLVNQTTNKINFIINSMQSNLNTYFVNDRTMCYLV